MSDFPNLQKPYVRHYLLFDENIEYATCSLITFCYAGGRSIPCMHGACCGIGDCRYANHHVSLIRTSAPSPHNIRSHIVSCTKQAPYPCSPPDRKARRKKG